MQKIVESANMSTRRPSKYQLAIVHPRYEESIYFTNTEARVMESIQLRKVLGVLHFLSTSTEPGKSKAVSMIANFQSKPAMRHWNIVNNVVR